MLPSSPSLPSLPPPFRPHPPLMVLMAAASDHDPAAKSSPPAPAPSSPSPSPSLSPAPAATSTRTRLHSFSFPTLSWGTHRLLRCSNNGASPPPHPHTPSPEKEKPQDSAAAGASQPPRPWNLRTRRSTTAALPASRSEVAGKSAAGQAQQSPAPPLAEARKRGFSVALTKEEIAEDFLVIRGTRPPRRPKKRPRAVQRQLDTLYPGLLLADVNLDSYKIEER